MSARFARYGAARACFLANSFDESEAFAAANGRAVLSTPGRADQHEAPAGQAALIDWAEIERTFAVSFTSGRGRLGAASGGWAAVPAAHRRCLG